MSAVSSSSAWSWLCALLLSGCEKNPYVIGRFLDDGCVERSEALVCSGFERPDLSEWDRTAVTNAGEIGQTDAQAHSGRGALYAASTDQESAAVVAAEFPVINEGELFLRVYLYVPEGRETKTTNVLFLGDEPFPDPFKGIDFNFEAGAPEIFVPENDPVRFTSTSLVIPRDRWFCYQVRVLVSEDEGAVTIRVDGEVALDESGLDTLPEKGLHLLRAGVDWSSLQTTPFEIYMDDLVLAPTPVECD